MESSQCVPSRCPKQKLLVALDTALPGLIAGDKLIEDKSSLSTSLPKLTPLTTKPLESRPPMTTYPLVSLSPLEGTGLSLPMAPTEMALLLPPLTHVLLFISLITLLIRTLLYGPPRGPTSMLLPIFQALSNLAGLCDQLRGVSDSKAYPPSPMPKAKSTGALSGSTTPQLRRSTHSLTDLPA